jgi:hypothetical protein
MRSELLKLQRFLQKPGECAIAAAASIANFYNKKVDYKLTRKIAKPDGEGMYTPEIGILLNKLGFEKVTIVSADIRLLDFKWATLSKEGLIKQLKIAGRYGSDSEDRYISRQYRNFLLDSKSDNELAIDLHFGNYIRKTLDSGIPLLANFNFNLFFTYPKCDDSGKNDPHKGDFSEHEVVIYGYDDNGVNILDSHHQLYKGRLARYRRGRYKMDWETLHTVMGFGDLIIPEKYSIERANELI